MRAAVVTPGKARSARVVDIEMPRPNAGEALIKVLEVGVDGTDIEINSGLYGKAPIGSDYLIMGHESIGVVHEPAGELLRGDIVVATVRRPCPENCLNCRNNEVDMCITGHYLERGITGRHGFMRDYYAETPDYLVKLPNELTDVGVLLEPLSIVEKGIQQSYKIQERMVWEPEKALVLGAGSLGIFASMLLRSKGLEVTTYDVVSVESAKAGIIRDIGASYVDGRDMPLDAVAKDMGNIDFILEATGNSTVAFKAMKIIGTNGVMCLTGVTGGSGKLEVCADCLNMQLVLGNKLVFGTVNSGMKHFKKGVDDMQFFNRLWPGVLGRMITRRVPLELLSSALEHRSGDIKAVIDVGTI
jgi:threonine dehydrogenase-like Zn-dependent dehydrogenase